MQSLEKIGILEQDEEKGGRRITQAGQRDLDRTFSLRFPVISAGDRRGGLLGRKGVRMHWRWDGGRGGKAARDAGIIQSMMKPGLTDVV